MVETEIKVKRWILRTWWTVWVVLGEGHLRLEVTAIVKGVRVQHDQGHAPLEDILVDELLQLISTGYLVTPPCTQSGICSAQVQATVGVTYLNVGPRLFAEALELIHEQSFRTSGHGFRQLLLVCRLSRVARPCDSCRSENAVV